MAKKLCEVCKSDQGVHLRNDGVRRCSQCEFDRQKKVRAEKRREMRTGFCEEVIKHHLTSHFSEPLCDREFYTKGVEGGGWKIAEAALIEEGRSVAMHRYGRWPTCCHEPCVVKVQSKVRGGKTKATAVMECSQHISGPGATVDCKPKQANETDDLEAFAEECSVERWSTRSDVRVTHLPTGITAWRLSPAANCPGLPVNGKRNEV